MFSIVLFSHTKDGWYPAILNSAEERDFVKQAQRKLTNDRSYWIGGSTSANAGRIINLDSYQTGDAGNDYNFFICHHEKIQDFIPATTFLKICTWSASLE